MTFGRILTNKTVLTGLEASGLKSSSLFKPAFGDAALMGKVTGSAPSLVLPKMKSGFKPDTGAFLSGIRSDSVGPYSVLKQVVR